MLYPAIPPTAHLNLVRQFFEMKTRCLMWSLQKTRDFFDLRSLIYTVTEVWFVQAGTWVVVPLRSSANQLQRALLPPRGTKVTIILTFQHVFSSSFFHGASGGNSTRLLINLPHMLVTRPFAPLGWTNIGGGAKKQQYWGWGAYPLGKTILVSMKKIFTIEG